MKIILLMLITAVSYLLWYTYKLHEIITKCLNLTERNTDLINKTLKASCDADDDLLDIIKNHLKCQHGMDVYKKEEEDE